jgi:hypothetical protein
MSTCVRRTPAVETAASSQPFPETGPLAEQLNQTFAALRRRLSTILQNRPVYSYIVTSGKTVDGNFEQTGCAPNFQGDVITLCTCKHKDRASPPPACCRGPEAANPWAGVWVAGMCSSTQLRPRALFYLMLVGRTSPSHAAAWRLLEAPRRKSAHRSPFGDIYEPRRAPDLDPWRASSYEPHLPGHAHDAHGREYDIERSFHGRHPRLLVGDEQHSYLWSRPAIRLQSSADTKWASAHHRFYARLSDFLALLE